MNNERFMQLALDEAGKALKHDDVPVGAVVVVNGDVVAQRHNEREKTQDPTSHAEILALQDAAKALGNWHLNDATLFVTLEPCSMCAGALVSSRLGSVVYGATDPKAGAAGSLYDICSDPRLNHQVPVTTGVLGDECGAILRDFFKAKRRLPTEA